MARIPDEVIERLKQEISLQRLAEAQGITLKKHGQDMIGLCPFHDDNDPSLVITPENNLWHCLGVCQSGGSVIDWVMKLEGVSFRHAVELLMNDYLPSANATGKVKRSTVPRFSTSIMSDSEDQQLLNRVIDYYHQTLKQNPDALAYLEKRGITNTAIKSSLMDAVLRFIPEEDKSQYSAMTGQSLFYMSETDLKHKILAIVEEEGAAQAAYALKLLQSEGQLTIASINKDPDTGKLVTQEYKVEGPVMIFLTTTAIEVDEELMNRCLVLTVNEDREQTQAIHQLQRQKRTLQGLIQKTESRSILTIHQNAQRLLKPLSVVNPYAEHLTFLNEQTRTRRDHEKYLTLIDTIALLHQYQRQIKVIPQGENTVHYVEVTLNDIAMANELAHEVLGRTLDELPPQTRKLLTLIDAMVTKQCNDNAIKRCDIRFSRREIREYNQWGNTQLRVHLDRLVEMEYLLPHRGGRGQFYVYELLYDGTPGAQQAHLNGLIDVETLKTMTMTESSRGQQGQLAGSKRPQNGGSTGLKRGKDINRKASNNKASTLVDDDNDETAYIEKKKSNVNGASYAAQGRANVAGAGSAGATSQSPSLVVASK